jgi:tight adherence protein B
MFLYLTVIAIGLWLFTTIYLIFNKIFVKASFIDRLQFVEAKPQELKENILKQKKYETLMAGIAKKIPRKKNSKLSLMLLRADILFSSEELIVYKIIFGIGLGFSAYVLSREVIYTLIIFLAIWFIPNMWIKSKGNKRLKDFEDQLNGGLTLMANALKAGHSFNQAISLSAKETQGSFSEEFKILLKELNFGLDMEDAFNNMMNRVPSLDLKLMINAIMIQKDVGGNLSEILDNISKTIRDRQKLKNEMKTLTAQGKMSGGIVLFLPLALGGIIYLMNPDYISLLFETKIGLALLGICFFNEVLGLFIIKKIITIDL